MMSGFYNSDTVQGSSLIIISKNAYLTIVKHVFTCSGPKFPDKTQWKEVMGLLVGRNVVGNTEISESVPFSEGSHDDVQFEFTDYVRMASLEPEYNVREPPEFFVGWYHSHFIGHTYSGVDIHNHLGWQTNLNPYAFGIVFDPQELSEDNPGICCIRLENPELEQASRLEYLDFIIQIPKQDRKNYIEFLQKEGMIS